MKSYGVWAAVLLISMGAPGNSMETDFTISRSTVPCRRNSHCSSKYTTPRARWCQRYVLAKMLPFALYGIWVCLLCDASTVRCRCFCFVWFHIGIQYEIKWGCRSWKNWKFVHCSMLSESSLSRDIWLISIGCLPHFLLYVQFWRYILCWYQPILLPQPLLSRKDPFLNSSLAILASACLRGLLPFIPRLTRHSKVT